MCILILVLLPDWLPNAFDITSKLFPTVAIILGGVWAIFNFYFKREGAWALQLSVDIEVLPYDSEHNKSLLILYVNLKNVGRRLIVCGSKGCTVTIKALPKILMEGVNRKDFGKQPVYDFFLWDESWDDFRNPINPRGRGAGRIILPTTDIVIRRKSIKSEKDRKKRSLMWRQQLKEGSYPTYEIEPGTEYREMLGVVLHSEDLIPNCKPK